MARSSHEISNVIWLNADRDDRPEAHPAADGSAVFFAFLIIACLAAEILSRAFPFWMEFERNLTLSFIASSSF